MSKMMSMTKRNCMVFLKDGGAVFFSLLSMVIVLMLMAVFLGEMNVDSVVNLLAEYGGVRDAEADRNNAKYLCEYWTLAGLMVVNSLTVSLTVIGTMVTDKTGDKLKSFYTAPVSKLTIAVSYIASAVVIGFFFCTLTFLGYVFYIKMIGGAMLSVVTILKVLGLTFVNVIVFSLLMYLVANLVNSSNAWGGIGTVVGTLVGFLGAIYVPVGSLPEGVVTVLKALPILHSTSLMRKIMCADALDNTFDGMHVQVLEGYREAMGIDILMSEKIVSDEVQLLFLGICGMITLVVIALVEKKKHDISQR